jgi:hypothetical protein
VRQAVLATGAGRREGNFAALLFAATMLYDYDYVGVNDPQMIAHAVQIFGLVLCLREPRTMPSLAGAAFLFVLALFVKHALIALPLAAGLWLLWRDRRSAFTLAAFGIAFVLCGAVAFRLAYGHSLPAELHNARVWWLIFSLHALGGRAVIFVPLAASLFLLHRARNHPPLVFCAGYAVLSVVLAAYFLGGAGTGGKMLFDAIIALSLCGGVGLAAMRNIRTGLSPAVFAACHLLPVAAYVLFRSAAGILPHHWLPPRAPAVEDTQQDVAFLQVQDGPVLCNEPALCFWAGKPFAVDLWGYEEAVAVGARDGHELLSAIAARRYAALQLGPASNALGAVPEADPKWSRKVSAAIAANYRVAYTSFNGTFWVPKE